MRKPAAGSSKAAMTEGYVELHARSAFSFLQGASLPEEMAQTAADLGYPAMALVDRDGFYGSPRFHLAAKKSGIRAHIGAEITCTDGFQYPLLVENRTGYQNLCRLVTRMKLRAKKGEGAATPEELAEFAKGVICLAPAAPFSRGSESAFAQLQHLIEFSAAPTSLLKSNATCIAKRKRATRRRLPRRGGCAYPSLPPMASGMRACAARGARCAHLHSESRAARRGGQAARNQ